MIAKGKAGAVATDDERCSKAGLEVLKGGGNAVDATVATLLCLGVVNFQSSRIGGGLMHDRCSWPRRTPALQKDTQLPSLMPEK